MADPMPIESDFRRPERRVPGSQRIAPRRLVAALLATLAGSLVLLLSLQVGPDSRWLYPALLAPAVAWLALARLFGPIPWLGPDRRPRGPQVLGAVVLGLALGAGFVVAGLLMARVDVAAEAARGLLAKADQSVVIALVVALLNAVGEEAFFRGALPTLLPPNLRWRWPTDARLWSTVVYTASVVFTGNVLLVLAAVPLGFVWAAQRRATGGILAPIITHGVWSTVMALVLPVVFAVA